MSEADIARELGISRQRVFVIIQMALVKVRRHFIAAGYNNGNWR